MDESVSATEPSWILDGLSSMKWQLHNIWGRYTGDQVAAIYMDHHGVQSWLASKHTMTLGTSRSSDTPQRLVGYGPSSATGMSSSPEVKRRKTVRT